MNRQGKGTKSRYRGHGTANTTQSEPPVRLGGFSFYTRLLLRLLLEEELSEVSSSSPNFSHGVKQS